MRDVDWTSKAPLEMGSAAAAAAVRRASRRARGRSKLPNGSIICAPHVGREDASHCAGDGRALQSLRPPHHLSQRAPPNRGQKLAVNPILEIAAKPDELTVNPVRLRQLSLFPPSRPLVERFGTDFFRSLPEYPAVYLMCGVQEGVLYVGKARNLRRRLAAYRSADPTRVPRKIRRLLASVSRIYWDECADEDAALARERELLKILRPRFNTVGTFSPPGRHVGWQRSGDALLLGCGDVTEGWKDRFGEFRRVQPVFAALVRLVWWG